MFESLFNKVADYQACNFIKKSLQHRCFPVNIVKFLRTPILKFIIVSRNLVGFLKLLTNIQNSKCPSIEPWRIPKLIFISEFVLWLLIFMNCFLFGR